MCWSLLLDGRCLTLDLPDDVHGPATDSACEMTLHVDSACGTKLDDLPCTCLYLMSTGAVGLGDGLTRPDLRCWTLRTRRERIWMRLDVSRILPDVKGSEPRYLHF